MTSRWARGGWAGAGANAGAEVDRRQVDLDVERHGDLEAVVKDTGEAVRPRGRVELVHDGQALVVVFLDPPEVRNAGRRVLAGFDLPVPLVGVGGDDFDGEKDVLGPVPGLVGTGIRLRQKHENIRLRPVLRVQLDGHFPHDVEMVRGLLQERVLQQPHTAHVEPGLRTPEDETPVDQLRVRREAWNPVKVVRGPAPGRRIRPAVLRLVVQPVVRYGAHRCSHGTKSRLSIQRTEGERQPPTDVVVVMSSR